MNNFINYFLAVLITTSFIPSKALGQSLNCRYGEWVNPSTNNLECFDLNKTSTTNINNKNSYGTKGYDTLHAELLSTYEMEFEYIESMLSSCIDIVYLNPSYEEKCSTILTTALANYKNGCDELLYLDLPRIKEVYEECYYHLEKFIEEAYAE